MAVFQYRAKKADGKIISGQAKAKSIESLKIKMQERNIEPIHIVEKRLFNLKDIGKTSKVSAQEITSFTRQLSFLISAGIPLIEALSTAKSLVTSTVLKEAVIDITNKVEGGQSFSEALRSKSNIFNTFYVNMVSASEEIGQLDQTLDNLALSLEKTEATKSKIKSAMVYPIAIFFVTIAIVGGIMFFVVPKFQDIYGNNALPALTQTLIDVSEFLVEKWYLVIGIFIATIFSFLQYYNTRSGKKTISLIVEKLPLFGGLVYKSDLALFCNSFNSLLNAGVNFLDALDVTLRICNHSNVVKGLTLVKKYITSGKKFTAGLKDSKSFTILIENTIAAAEESGSMDKAFERLASYYEEEVDKTVTTAIKLIEPLMIVFIGGIVSVLILALYLPVFSIGDVI